MGILSFLASSMNYIRFTWEIIHRLTPVYLFGWIAFDITRNLFVISVNEGLASGSCDQHSSINFLHSGSHRSGIGGLSVFVTIPPSRTPQNRVHIQLYIGKMYFCKLSLFGFKSCQL